MILDKKKIDFKSILFKREREQPLWEKTCYKNVYITLHTFLLFPLKWNIDSSLINVVASINEEV